MQFLRFTVLLVSWFMLSRVSLAQNGPWDTLFERSFESSINEDVVDCAQEVLVLSEEQRAVLERSLADHRQRFYELVSHWRPIAQEFEARMNKLVPWTVPHFEIQLEREATLAEAADAQAALDKRFLDEIRGILTVEQEARYTKFINRVTHKRWTIPGYGYPEQGIDLVVLVTDLVEQEGIDLPRSVFDALDEYDATVSAKLRELAALRVNRSREWIRRDLERYENDGKTVSLGRMTNAQRVRFKEDREREGALLRDIRDATRRCAAILEGILPGAIGSKFRQAYINQSMRPYVRIETLPLTSYVRRVLEIEGLSLDQREAIDSLIDEHQALQRRAEQEILSAVDKSVASHYDSSDPREVAGLSALVNEAVQRRIALDEKLFHSVDSMLTPEQRQIVPMQSGEMPK